MENQRNRRFLESTTNLIAAHLAENIAQISRLMEKNNRQFSMYKRPSHLNKFRKYTIPKFVSIGPYHRGRKYLRDGEVLKWNMLHKFLLEGSESLSLLVKKMNDIESIIRGYYSPEVLVNMGTAEFLEMMLVDGVFLLEVLCQSSQHNMRTTTFHISSELMDTILIDLIKLENQLPLLILEILSQGKLTDIAIVSHILYRFKIWHQLDLRWDHRFLACKHVLDLLLSFLFPKPMNNNGRTKEESQPFTYSLPGVAELCKSGVCFKVRRAHNYMDIVCTKSIIEIPPICITESTKTLIINCVALEQCGERAKHKMKCCSDYVAFMSHLINQPRDVALLCQSGIISHSFQQDECITNFFKELAEVMAFDTRCSCLKQQLTEIEEYHYSTRARLRREYFSSALSYCPAIYAGIIILLGITQTTMAILSYCKA